MNVNGNPSGCCIKQILIALKALAKKQLLIYIYIYIILKPIRDYKKYQTKQNRIMANELYTTNKLLR